MNELEMEPEGASGHKTKDDLGIKTKSDDEPGKDSSYGLEWKPGKGPIRWSSDVETSHYDYNKDINEKSSKERSL
jgi:hypothetical protein